ncbi:MAG: bifunctional 4-hydroxy-2-oxoglutarate aldolase/2-dehydro-3-deoxy-phosphogluconate aldolase [Anaerolineae bacterium]|jgi:2-dehydro-3-deoxyphosphogluconate aldolase/(4S)-4-hydroxy-2-oxoglutarate aldolase
MDLLTRLLDSGIVAIVRLSSAEHLMRVADAIAAGGVRYIEFTMTTPRALETLQAVTERYGDELVFGAGTVLDADTARQALLAGARFVVAPTLDAATIQLCKRYSALAMPGAFTPTEILRAWELGADVVKVFPSDVVGPAYIKAIKAPLPQVRLAPVGGVSIDNIADYVRAGADCVGVGSSLVSNALVANSDWPALTARAAAMVAALQQARVA